MASRRRTSISGATIVEFSAVFPIILLICFGAADFTVLTIKWLSLNKATYAGVRMTAVLDPVAVGVNAAIEGGAAGASCFDPATGDPNGNCQTVAATVCTGDASGGKCCPTGSSPLSCSPNYPWNEVTFQKVLTEMNRFVLIGSIDRRQLQITYQPTNYGFAHRPVGAPMNVTVAVRCSTYPFYLLYPLMGWAMPGRPASCSGIPGSGINLPEFPSTIAAEDLKTEN